MQFKCHFRYQNDYICQLETVYEPEIIELISVSGNHIEISRHQKGDNFQVKELYSVYYKNFRVVPRKIATIFPNLTKITLAKSSIKKVSSNDLIQFPKLEVLDLSGNHLTSLESDLFKFTPNIKRIYLSLNSLRHIPHDVLDGLNNLEIAEFEYNECIHIKLSDSGRDQMKKLFHSNCQDEDEDLNKQFSNLIVAFKGLENRIEKLEKQLLQSN